MRSVRDGKGREAGAVAAGRDLLAKHGAKRTPEQPDPSCRRGARPFKLL